MPGKKIILPQTIRAIASTVRELDRSIFEIAKNASLGDLTYRIDGSNYNGNWATLTEK